MAIVAPGVDSRTNFVFEPMLLAVTKKAMRLPHELHAIRRAWRSIVPGAGAGDVEPVALTDDHTLVIFCPSQSLADQFEQHSDQLAIQITEHFRETRAIKVLRVVPLVVDEATVVLARLILQLQEIVANLSPQ